MNQIKLTQTQIAALSRLYTAPGRVLQGRNGWANGKTIAWMLRIGYAEFDAKVNRVKLAPAGVEAIETYSGRVAATTGSSVAILGTGTEPGKGILAEIETAIVAAQKALELAQDARRQLYGN
jgi:hypothetical protein